MRPRHGGTVAQRGTASTAVRDFQTAKMQPKDVSTLFAYAARVLLYNAGRRLTESIVTDASVPPPVHGSVGERRQLTVLFADITDSTGLSERCDPEDLRDVLLRFQALCAGCIDSHGGRVVNYIGDGIRAQFGYPIRSENEAENAVRAGLAILRGMEELNASAAVALGEPVRLRIGIHTGWAVIGSGGSGHVHSATEIVGDTPNIAFRLQEIGLPNSITVSDATRRLLRDKFRMRGLGDRMLKGLSRQIGCFQLLGEGNDGIVSRLANPIAGVPLVGRTAELAALAAAWDRVQAGEGQAIEVGGEAGIGKSRLVAEFISRSAHAAPLYALQASADHQNVPFYPVIRLLEQKAGIRRDEDHETGLGRLRALLAEAGRAGPEPEWLLGELLGVPVAGPTDLIALDAQDIRRRTRELLTALLTAHGRDGAGVLLAEDLHWADPSTQELVNRIAGRIGAARILLLATSRESRLTAHPNGSVARITLQRLDESACLALASSVVQGRGRPSSILLDGVVARSDGIPLFIEELVVAALETGELQRSERPDAEPHNVPSALYDPLMIRLERLGEAKRIAQMASVIGRSFSSDLLAAVAAEPLERIDAALDRLAESGVVRADTSDLKPVFTFKHALVRDVAYYSLLKRQRRELHARVAETLELPLADSAEAEPAYLANHLAEAGLTARAVRAWLTAARRATEKTAHLEALAQLHAALHELGKLPDGRERDALELDVQIALIAPTIAVCGYSAEDVARVSRRAIELSVKCGDDRRILPALYARWSYDRCTGNIREACRGAEDFLRRAEQADDPIGRAAGHRLLGTSLLLIRRFADARDQLQHAIAQCDPHTDRAEASVYSIDVRSTSHTLLSILAWHLGDPAGGAEQARRGMQLAIEMRHANTLGYAVAHACMFYTYERDVGMVQALANRVQEAAAERELPFWMTIARTFLGWCEIQSGRPAEGIAILDRERAYLARVNLISWMPVYLCWLTEAHLQLGETGHAQLCLTQAREMIAGGGEAWYDPECWRLAGRLAQLQGSQGGARDCFEHALALSRRDDDRGFALRAAMDLAGHLSVHGQVVQARAVLDEALRSFGQQPVAGDRAHARALLNNLA